VQVHDLLQGRGITQQQRKRLPKGPVARGTRARPRG
jgi:hypothetical protein